MWFGYKQNQWLFNYVGCDTGPTWLQNMTLQIAYIVNVLTDGQNISHNHWLNPCYILTSAGAKAQRSPRVAARLWPSELGRSKITAQAPWLTSRSTVARPKPEAPPVTRPTMPCQTQAPCATKTLSQVCPTHIVQRNFLDIHTTTKYCLYSGDPHVLILTCMFYQDWKKDVNNLTYICHALSDL